MDITVLPVPSAGGQDAAPFVGVQGVYLSSKSNNALQANQFLTYLAGEAPQKVLFEEGKRFPALEALAATVEDKNLKGFGEAGAKGQPMPSIPAMGAVWEFWGAAEVSIIDGSAADPVAAWQQMIGNIEAKIKK